MFTGLVEELGRVKTVVKGARSVRITILAQKVVSDVKLGDSIAVNGACLTVVDWGTAWFTADVMPETVDKTALACLQSGDDVNLERTLRVCDRLGGHIVSGHIDGVGIIATKQKNDNAMVVKIETKQELMRYIVKKGSIAIDGISLTVADCSENWFTVSLIPHTSNVTTLNKKSPGELVNLETDIIGKYVEKLLSNSFDSSQNKEDSSISLEFLQKHGFSI